MIFRLFKFVAGYVIFTAKGGFAERFINLCAVRRINLWNVTLSDNTIVACVNIREFKKLRGVARKTGVHISIREKRGVPFYLRAHKDRVGLLIGACIFLFFMTFMNTFVWCIQTHSSEKISRYQILQAAENAGLHYGVFVKSFDEEKAAREIYKAFDGELSWVKVNIKGSLAVIDFRDKVKNIQIEEKGEPANIVADFDGIILSDETYQGSKNKSRGDVVSKGEVLISGVVEGVDMKPLYYEAKGKFTALHQRLLEFTLDNQSEFYSYKKLSEKTSLNIFGLDIPLSFSFHSAKNTTVYTYESYIEFEGYRLPFGIKKTVAVKDNISSITASEREKLAVLSFSEKEYDAFSDTRILESDIKLIKEKNGFKIEGLYDCIDFIGESRSINIENSENIKENS